LERVGQLYGIEQEIRGRSQGRGRKSAGPGATITGSDAAWLKATLGNLSRKSDVAVAIRYALQRWSALLRYFEDGRVEMDNNAADRALRAVALGGKNIPP
jgi:hypothetical protein